MLSGGEKPIGLCGPGRLMLRPQVPMSLAADAALAIHRSGLILPRRQTDVGADLLAVLEAVRIVDRGHDHLRQTPAD